MEATVYHNWGRWVADCPDVACTNAEEYGRGLTDTAFVCSDCRRISEVVWPDDRVRITALLDIRPVPSTRNWTPSETVADLVNENLEQGVI